MPRKDAEETGSNQQVHRVRPTRRVLLTQGIGNPDAFFATGLRATGPAWSAGRRCIAGGEFTQTTLYCAKKM